jgi:ABC-type phosphate transport system permease subunit
MDTIPAIIIGLIIVVYGVFVYCGKLLWFLTSYKTKFKGETNENYKRKTYRTYGILFLIIGTVVLITGGIVFFKGITV